MKIKRNSSVKNAFFFVAVAIIYGDFGRFAPHKAHGTIRQTISTCPFNH
jgi:hypothetical protein